MNAALKIHLTRPELAKRPQYATSGSAGMDLCAAISTPLTIHAGTYAQIPIGIALAIPAGFEGQVRPRSGLAARHGVTVLNAPGTIDADYRGELQVLLVNHGQESYTIEPGERVAQLVLAPVAQLHTVLVEAAEELGSTLRATGGFGSTGRH